MAEILNQINDPNTCSCDPCKLFWKDTFKNGYECLLENGVMDSNVMDKLKAQTKLCVGDRVTVFGRPGMVKFVGFVDVTVAHPVFRVGVKLDESIPFGHNGLFLGKRYFRCRDGNGVFARIQDVVPLQAANKRPAIRGNFMFPSWPDVCKKRKEQGALLTDRRKKAASPKPPLRYPSPNPPAISPRLNRAQQLRHELISMERVPGEYLYVKEDPLDMAFKTQQQAKKKELLEAKMPTEQTTESWDQGMRQKWKRKYHDPEKASRMGDTLLKLCSAYKEGMKLK